MRIPNVTVGRIAAALLKVKLDSDRGRRHTHCTMISAQAFELRPLIPARLLLLGLVLLTVIIILPR